MSKPFMKLIDEIKIKNILVRLKNSESQSEEYVKISKTVEVAI